jgi:hypothetical protein
VRALNHRLAIISELRSIQMRMRIKKHIFDYRET